MSGVEWTSGSGLLQWKCRTRTAGIPLPSRNTSAGPGAGLGAEVILTTGEASKGRRRRLPLFDVGDDEAEQRVEFAVNPGGLITCFAGFVGFLRFLFLRRGPSLGNWHPVLGVGHCIRDMH